MSVVRWNRLNTCIQWIQNALDKESMLNETAETERSSERVLSWMLHVNRCKHAAVVKVWRPDDIRRARTDRNADFF